MTALFLIISSIFYCSHPLHVSFTSVELDFARQEVALTYKFNTDDFSLLFFHLYEKNIKPEMDQDLTGAQLSLIDSYLEKAFTMALDADTIDFKYVSKEQDEEYIWLYYRGQMPEFRKGYLRMTNTLLLELNQDQTNLVILTYGGLETGNTFNFSTRKWEVAVGQD